MPNWLTINNAIPFGKIYDLEELLDSLLTNRGRSLLYSSKLLARDVCMECYEPSQNLHRANTENLRFHELCHLINRFWSHARIMWVIPFPVNDDDFVTSRSHRV